MICPLIHFQIESELVNVKFYFILTEALIVSRLNRKIRVKYSANSKIRYGMLASLATHGYRRSVFCQIVRLRVAHNLGKSADRDAHVPTAGEIRWRDVALRQESPGNICRAVYHA